MNSGFNGIEHDRDGFVSSEFGGMCYPDWDIVSSNLGHGSGGGIFSEYTGP